jgi:hypothetical protein
MRYPVYLVASRLDEGHLCEISAYDSILGKRAVFRATTRTTSNADPLYVKDLVCRVGKKTAGKYFDGGARALLDHCKRAGVSVTLRYFAYAGDNQAISMTERVKGKTRECSEKEMRQLLEKVVTGVNYKPVFAKKFRYPKQLDEQLEKSFKEHGDARGFVLRDAYGHVALVANR